MRIRLALLVPALAALILTQSHQAVGADKTLKLFDGKTLKGWDGDPKFWSVRDGVITGETTKDNPTQGNTFLIWRDGTVKDFELALKYRIVGGNSGIQYRSKEVSKWVIGGYQADFEAGETWNGILYEERGRGILGPPGDKSKVGADGKPVKVGSVSTKEDINKAIKREQWNEYTVRAKGNELRHAINGVTTAEVTDEDEAKRVFEGLLALQLHAGPPMVVQFKDIKLSPL